MMNSYKREIDCRCRCCCSSSTIRAHCGLWASSHGKRLRPPIPHSTLTAHISLSLSLSVSSCLHSTTSMCGPLPLARANSLLRPSLKNMFILSSAPSPSATFSVPLSPTLPFPTFNFLSVSLPPRSTSSRSLASSCSLYSLKVTAKKYVVMDKDSPPENLATSVSYRTFLSARTEQELLSRIRKEAEAGSLPSNVAAAMEELYQNYKNEVRASPAGVA